MSRIWIDAVCVDQDDHADRSRQVANMADVYARARQVLIFLGSPFEGSTEIMSAMEGLERDLGLQASLVRGNEAGSHDASKMEACLDRLNLELLGRFFSSPWFFRLWVIQEIVLCPRATFFYGSVGVDSDHALAVATYLRTGDYISFSSETRKIEHMEGMEYATELYEARHWRYSPYTYRKKDGDDDRIGGLNLGFLLESFHDRLNAEPLDKIYAVRGLCSPRTAASIKPDYSKSLRDVYLQATTLAMTEVDSLALLRNGRTLGHRPLSWYKDNNWPTWSPCWQDRFDLIKNPSFITGLGIALRGLSDPVVEMLDLRIDGDTLSFNGRIIDKIAQVTAPISRYEEPATPDEDNHDPASTENKKSKIVVRPQEIEEAISRCLRLDTTRLRLPDGRSIISIIGETLVGGSVGFEDDVATGEAHFESILRYTQHHMLAIHLSAAAHPKIAANLGDPALYLTQYDVHSTFRLCYISEDGYFGLASEHAVIGDVICVPVSTRRAFILRPEGDHFLLVGQCYMNVCRLMGRVYFIADCSTGRVLRDEPPEPRISYSASEVNQLKKNRRATENKWWHARNQSMSTTSRLSRAISSRIRKYGMTANPSRTPQKLDFIPRPRS